MFSSCDRVHAGAGATTAMRPAGVDRIGMSAIAVCSFDKLLDLIMKFSSCYPPSILGQWEIFRGNASCQLHELGSLMSVYHSEEKYSPRRPDLLLRGDMSFDYSREDLAIHWKEVWVRKRFTYSNHQAISSYVRATSPRERLMHGDRIPNAFG